jgi:hypothetical protein
MKKLKPDATGIYVAAHQAPAAIEEAIEAEVPLIVAVAEHIPIHDILRVSDCFWEKINELTVLDTLYATNSVKIPPRGSQLTWYNFRNWQV